MFNKHLNHPKNPFLNSASKNSLCHQTKFFFSRSVNRQQYRQSKICCMIHKQGFWNSVVSSSLLLAGSATATVFDQQEAQQIYQGICSKVAEVRVLQGDNVIITGSGIVWDQFRHIVTDYATVKNVLKNKQVIKVGVLGSDIQFVCSVLAQDAALDLAVLQIDNLQQFPDNILQPLQLGDSEHLKVGQRAYAIGSKYGVARSMSVGVISGLQRSVTSPTGQRIRDVIQTDASVSTSGSGGVLSDSNGHIIGMTLAGFRNEKMGENRGSGVNFALPTNVLIKYVPNLIVYKNSLGKSV